MSVVRELDHQVLNYNFQPDTELVEIIMSREDYLSLLQECAFIIGKKQLKWIKKYRGIPVTVDEKLKSVGNRHHVFYRIIKRSRNWDDCEQPLEGEIISESKWKQE